MSTTELFGIRNGHLVDEKLLRGGDVTEEGIAFLRAQGVRRVICLKNKKQDDPVSIVTEKLWVLSAGMWFSEMPLDSSGVWSYDDGKKIDAILDTIATSKGKVFVHCAKGSDRTGVVVACYQIQGGASSDEALKEMKSYGAARIHFGMRAAVRHFAWQQRENET